VVNKDEYKISGIIAEIATLTSETDFKAAVTVHILMTC